MRLFDRLGGLVQLGLSLALGTLLWRATAWPRLAVIAAAGVGGMLATWVLAVCLSAALDGRD
jgi:hypothetical protein